MTFRARGRVLIATAAPTGSIELGDPFITGGSSLAADAFHQHAFPTVDLVGKLSPGGLGDLSAAYLARAAAFADLGPGGTIDLSPIYATRRAAGAAMVYLDGTHGNDANDGRDDGRPKATLAAALAVLPGRSGKVRIIGPTALPNNTTTFLTVDGSNTGDPAKLVFEGDGSDTSVLTYTGSADALSSGTSVNVPGGAFVMDGVALIGSGTSGNCRGLYLKRYQQASALFNVKITGFAYANLHLYRCYGMALVACHLTGSAGWGCLFDNSNGFVAIATRFSSNTAGGARAFYNPGGAPFDEAGAAAAAGLLLGCLCEGNTGPALRTEGANAINVIGGYVEANGGNGQFELTGPDAVHVSTVRALGVRFNAAGVSTRAIWADFAQVFTGWNQSYGHSTCFLEATANATVRWGPGHQNGTRGPDGADGDAAILIDNSRQTQNVRRSIFDDVIPVTIQYKITDPAASVTNADVPIEGSALATPRMAPTGSWECSSIFVRTTAAPTAGSIKFFARSGTTDLSAALVATLSGGATTVAAGSNGAVMPQGTINVADTSSFASSGPLVIAGIAGTVSYTGKTPTTFTGCTGGTGTLATGAAVTQGIAFDHQPGNARSTTPGATIGIGYTTSGAYAAPAGAEYTVIATFILKPFAG